MTEERKLVEKNLGLVGYVVRKTYCPRHLTKGDLFQEGVIGLIDATKKFDSKRGKAFSSFAHSCIQYQINNYLRKNKPLYPYKEDPQYDMFDDEFFEALDLKIALNDLPQMEKKALDLLYYQGLTLVEAGQKLCVSHTSVARLRDRALARLREKVA